MKINHFVIVMATLVALFLSSCRPETDEVITSTQGNDLSRHFKKYSIVDFSANELFSTVEGANKQAFLDLKLPKGDGAFWTVSVTRDDLLAEDFVAERDGETMKSGFSTADILTLEGFQNGNPADQVALVVTREFAGGTILENGVVWHLEPLMMYQPEASLDKYIVYSEEAVISSGEKVCETIDSPAGLSDSDGLGTIEESDKAASCWNLEIRIHGDYEFYQQASYNYNLAVFAILVHMNNAELKYTPLNTDFSILSVSILTAPQNALYYPKSSNVGTLLQQTRDFWNFFQANTKKDLVILFTGKNTGIYGGKAYLASVCKYSNQYSYAVVRNYPGENSLMANIIAHEVGHTLGATHPNDPYVYNFCADGLCANYNGTPNEIMNSISSYNSSEFSACSLKEMACHIFFNHACLNTANCH
ncbi:MAG: hypothetical protein H6581_10105 [Bacteroidia bacterium]|nr:hypothetical protein [Bacteroidia bacterium]